MSPVDLKAVMENLRVPDDPDLLVGFRTNDDAGVYRLSDDVALIQTADYITPLTDDPYSFGQVAAANALSDVYAMGGRPLTAMNLCNFPGDGIPTEDFQRILQGGADKVDEADATVVGGHTVVDDELKYGLSVTGVVHPGRIVTNSGAEPGDSLILTKPIGSGILFNAVKKEALDVGYLEKAVDSMVVLNKVSAELMLEHGVHGCTDISGFGILGHALEMARASQVGISIEFTALPLFQMAIETSAKGFRPGMSKGNRALVKEVTRFDREVTEADKWLCADPQTSGGLLIAVAEENASPLLAALHSAGVNHARIIGRCISETEPFLEVTKSSSAAS